MKIFATVAAAVSAATLLAGCGSSTATTVSKTYKQPASGVPSSYKGALPEIDPKGNYSNPQPYDKVKDGGTLNIALNANVPTNWNLMNIDGNTGDTNTIWSMYMPNLVNVDAAGDIPTVDTDYLTSMKELKSSPLTVEYNINPKANWNDGSPIDWTAFEATWKTQSGKDPAYNVVSSDGWDDIKSVEQGSSPKQVIVTFTKGFYPWQTLFTTLLNPKSEDAKTFNSGWVNDPHNEWAAGPFIIKSHDTTQLTLVRNPKWWGRTPRLDQVTMKNLQADASLNAFQNGELDATGASTASRLKVVRGMKNVQLRMGYSAQVNVFTLNAKAAPLDDLQVRKALTQSISTKELNKIRYQGLGWNPPQAGSLLILPYQAGYVDNRPKDSDFSTANAKKTLEADGYKMGSDGYYQKGGKTLTIAYTIFDTDAMTTAIENALQQMTKQAGIKLTIDTQPSTKFNDVLTSAKYQMVGMGWGGNAFGFITSGTQLYGSKSDSNLSYVGNATIDKLFAEVPHISDLAKQKAASNTAEKEALKLYPTIPWVTAPSYTAVKAGLANFGPNGLASTDWTVVGWQK